MQSAGPIYGCFLPLHRLRWACCLPRWCKATWRRGCVVHTCKPHAPGRPRGRHTRQNRRLKEGHQHSSAMHKQRPASTFITTGSAARHDATPADKGQSLSIQLSSIFGGCCCEGDRAWGGADTAAGSAHRNLQGRLQVILTPIVCTERDRSLPAAVPTVRSPGSHLKSLHIAVDLFWRHPGVQG